LPIEDGPQLLGAEATDVASYQADALIPVSSVVWPVALCGSLDP